MKTVYVLIGLKGSGKTYIGNLLSKRLAIPFLRVEDIFLKIKTENPLEDQDYISTGYKNVEAAIRNILSNFNEVTIESTGIASQFNEMILRLRHDYIVKLIKVEANPELCFKRVKNRNISDHINISDDGLIEINKRARLIILNFDLILLNETQTDDELIREFSSMEYP